MEFLADFYRSRLAEAGVAPLIRDLPTGVQVASRAGADGRYLFVMNFSGKPVQVQLPEGMNLLTGAATGETAELAVNGAAVVRIKEA